MVVQDVVVQVTVAIDYLRDRDEVVEEVVEGRTIRMDQPAQQQLQVLERLRTIIYCTLTLLAILALARATTAR